MAVSVDRILVERRLLGERTGRGGLWVSVIGHALFIAALVISPLLHPQVTKPIQFVTVALVSAQALGVRNPPPATAPPREAAPARPEPAPPEPAKPEVKAPSPMPQKPVPKPATQPQPATPSATTAGSDTLRRREGSPTGSTTGTAALGARVGFDNPNFTHSYYIDRLTAMLAAQWQRPAIGGELVALVHFTIRRDGSVVGVSVVESSGYSTYDLAALRAVQQAAPFPPLPQSYTQDSLGVTVEFI